LGGWDEWNKKNKKSDEREKRENLCDGVDGVVVNLLYRIKSLAQWKITDEREMSEMTTLADDDTNIKKKSTQNCMHIEAC